MRLSEVRVGRIDRAIEIYLDHAYQRDDRNQRWPKHELAADAPPEKVLELFQREEAPSESGAPCVRFSMRLGNRNYPFMKLVLQEHILAGEYYFMVDTHDHMDIKPSYPDYEAWQAVRRFNDELKRKIERDFTEHNIPTAACIKEAICGREAEAEVPDRGKHILVVDDEADIASAVTHLLRSWGFQTSLASDGCEGVELVRARQPDLVILDYELPEMDGLEVLEALRRDPRTCDIPVLLCTASRISVEDIGKADGFLAKPFQESLLQGILDRLLASASARRDSARDSVRGESTS